MRKILLLIALAVPLLLSARTLEEKWILCSNVNCQILDSYYEDGVSFTWDGEILNNKAHGHGTAIRYINNELHSTFVGNYENGIRVGHGKLSWADGRELECEFTNNQATGQGKQIDPNGDVYSGQFINYILHGNGKIEKANGVVMEGSFVLGSLYTGKITNITGAITYYYRGAESPTEQFDKTSTYNPVIGQIVTEFFNADWQRCEAKDALYYRRIKYKAPNIPDGEVRDYFIDGQLQCIFTPIYIDYADSKKNFYEGKFVSYFENGNKEQEYTYYNSQADGKVMFYYQNGQVFSICDYEGGVKNGEYYEYYQTGKLHRYALYERGRLVDGKFVELDENGTGYLVYNEYFGEHPEAWVLSGENNRSALSLDGTSVTLTSSDGNKLFQRSCYIPFDQTQDYKIEAKIRGINQSKYTKYGLIFGFQDWDNYYCLLVSHEGKFAIVGEYEGVVQWLRNWSYSSSKIYTDRENLLKVFKMDDRFIFAINGVTVAQTPAKNLRGNRFGMISYSSGSFVMSSLSVNEFTYLARPQDAYPTANIPSGKQTTQPANQTTDWLWSGSGFFISEKGYIATNHHVVDGAKQMQVTFKQKGQTKTYKAEVVVTDPTNDLAIIKIVDNSFVELPKIPYVFTAKTEDVGTNVFALGYPKTQKLGEEIKFTDGTISAKTGAQGDIRLYQISVPITHGNSGGPLFDKQGNLIGITSSGWDNEDNINYAIKSIYLKNLIEVMPETITLPNDTSISDKSLVDMIKILSDFVPFIEAK